MVLLNEKINGSNHAWWITLCVIIRRKTHIVFDKFAQIYAHQTSVINFRVGNGSVYIIYYKRI